MTSPFRHATTFTILAIATCTLNACQTDVRPLTGQPDPIPAPYNDPQISVTSPDLQQWLAFHQASVVRGDETPMTVTVPMRNLADDRWKLDYRFLFFDETGTPLNSQMSWRSIEVYPKAVETLTASALDQRARNWKLQVRWGR